MEGSIPNVLTSSQTFIWQILTVLQIVQNWFKIVTGGDQRYISIQLPICCLLPQMHGISGYDPVNSFSHIGKKTTFQSLKNKINELTDTIGFGEFPSLSLESPSVVASIQYI